MNWFWNRPVQRTLRPVCNHPRMQEINKELRKKNEIINDLNRLLKKAEDELAIMRPRYSDCLNTLARQQFGGKDK